MNDWKRITDPPSGYRRSMTYNDHPLRLFFRSRQYTHNEGMNWLQNGGYVSDNCVTAEDVARCDAERVLYRAGWSRERIAASFENLMPREMIVEPFSDKPEHRTAPNQDSRIR